MCCHPLIDFHPQTTASLRNNPCNHPLTHRYQFGAFSPVFRTHGCRNGPSEPDSGACKPAQGSCGFNEVWSYGSDTQPLLEKYVRLRSDVLKPYIMELDKNVSTDGVPTMRPLAYEFPTDKVT